MIKTLAKSIREYKKPSILSPIFVSIEVILECLMPLVIVWFMDALETSKTSSELMNCILVYGGSLIGMAILSLATGMLSGRFAARASAGFAKNLRKDMYYAIQNYSFANIDRFSTSSLVTRQTTDVTNVQMAYMMIIRVAIRCPFMLIFSLVMSFTVNVTISWVFLALVPVLAAVLVIVIFKTHPIFERVFHKYDNMNRSVREDIKGIRVVKSFVREDFEKKKFKAASEDVCKDFTLAERIMAINGPVMQFCIWLAFLLIFLLAAIITGQAMEANNVSGAVTGGEGYSDGNDALTDRVANALPHDLRTANGGGDVLIPSTLHRDGWTVCVSSEGRVPAFPPYVIERIDEMLDPSYDAMLALLVDLRAVIRERIPTQPARAEFLAGVLADEGVWDLLREGRGGEARALALERGGLQ